MCWHSLALLSLVVIASASSASEQSRPAPSPVHTDEVTELRTPIAIISAGEFWDGGTVWVKLRDAKGVVVQFSVAQSSFDSEIPPDTLFLNASHPMERDARLPLTAKEAKLIVDRLQSAVEKSATKEALRIASGDPIAFQTSEHFELPEDQQRTDQEWNVIFAANALQRLKKATSLPIRSQDGSESPKWFSKYDDGRRNYLAEQEAQRAAHQRFMACFPEESHQYFVLDHSPGTDSSEELRGQSERLTNSVGGPTELVLMTCKALGTGSEWQLSRPREIVAASAVANVSKKELLTGLQQIGDDELQRRGAARLLLTGHGVNSQVDEIVEHAIRCATVVLKQKNREVNQDVLNYLYAQKNEASLEILRQIADGNVGGDSAESPAGLDECVLSIRAGAYLGLAIRGDDSRKTEIESKVKNAGKCDRMALQVALALLGDMQQLQREHFQIRSHEIAMAAVLSVVRDKGRHGLNFLVEDSLSHDYAAVSDAAVKAIERITGQNWSNATKAQPRFVAPHIREWWTEHGEEFVKSARSES